MKIMIWITILRYSCHVNSHVLTKRVIRSSLRSLQIRKKGSVFTCFYLVVWCWVSIPFSCFLPRSLEGFYQNHTIYVSRPSQYGLCSKVEIRVVFLSVFVSGAFFCFFFRGTNVLEEFRVVLPYFLRFREWGHSCLCQGVCSSLVFAVSPWVRFCFPAIPSSVVDIVFGAGLVVVLS